VFLYEEYKAHIHKNATLTEIHLLKCERLDLQRPFLGTPSNRLIDRSSPQTDRRTEVELREGVAASTLRFKTNGEIIV